MDTKYESFHSPQLSSSVNGVGEWVNGEWRGWVGEWVNGVGHTYIDRAF